MSHSSQFFKEISYSLRAHKSSISVVFHFTRFVTAAVAQTKAQTQLQQQRKRRVWIFSLSLLSNIVFALGLLVNTTFAFIRDLENIKREKYQTVSQKRSGNLLLLCEKRVTNVLGIVLQKYNFLGACH